MTHAEQLAWLAGFYEGEGHITFSCGVVKIGFTNTDLSVIERVQGIIDCGRIQELSRTGNRRACYQLIVARQDDVSTIIQTLWPYLSERRQDQILAAVTQRHEYEQARPPKVCRGCGCPYDEHTEGCKVCYFRHWNRNAKQRA